MCVGSILKVNKRRERLPRRLPVRFSTALLHNVGLWLLSSRARRLGREFFGSQAIPTPSGDGLASPVALAAYW